jgi:hypothetical protein
VPTPGGRCRCGCGIGSGSCPGQKLEGSSLSSPSFQGGIPRHVPTSLSPLRSMCGLDGRPPGHPAGGRDEGARSRRCSDRPPARPGEGAAAVSRSGVTRGPESVTGCNARGPNDVTEARRLPGEKDAAAPCTDERESDLGAPRVLFSMRAWPAGKGPALGVPRRVLITHGPFEKIVTNATRLLGWPRWAAANGTRARRRGGFRHA